MNRFLRFLFGLAALGLFVLLAGLRTTPGDDWLPIPPADLAMKDNPAQPGANAMILYRRSHVDAKRTNTDEDFDEEYYRIKIFTAEGVRQEGKVRIFFSKEDSDIKDIHARTVEPEGRIVNFDGNVLEENVATRSGSTLLAKTILLADVQPGCIIEYRYRHQYRWEPGPVHYLHAQSWVVSGRLFTRDASFSINPYNPRGTFDPTLYFRTTGLPKGSLPQKQGNGWYSMEVHNIPGIEEEPLMPPERALQARVEFFYRIKGEPVGETTEQFWNRMGKRWSDELDKFLSKKSVLEGELSQTVAAGDSPEVKLRKIYARAQKIRDLSYEPARTAIEKKAENIKADQNVEDVLKQGYATGRQINWFFVGLARAAGFEASEVYVVPRNQDVFIPSGQNTRPLTADIVWARAGGKEYWLDPAALFYPFDLLPWYETESKGVRVSKQGGEFIETPAAASSDATLVRRADLEMKEDGTASGKLQVDLAGQTGALRRTWHRRDDETGRRKALENEIKPWLPGGSTFEVTSIANWDDTSVPLHVEGNVVVPGMGSVTGHRMIVPLTVFVTSFSKSFETERRVNPVHFNFRYEEMDDVKIHGPAAYKIETIPPRKVINPGTAMSYEILPSQQGDTLEVKRRLTVSEINYPADSYAALRSFFNLAKSDDQAQVVLQNAETSKND
jgi:Domain of Unknown Function with PDB structure (DUF3857)